MKRSKLFLGISACVLAIVAFTAAKTAKFSNLRTAYYHSSVLNLCTIKASLLFYSVAGVGAIQATSGSVSSPVHAALFTYNRGGMCSAVLYSKGSE